MKRLIVAGVLCLAMRAANAQQPRALDIYWIDVEGGAATLIVTPNAETVLMDAGWKTEDDRDAIRIVAAMGDAGITKIDTFIASHFHSDHVSGLPALARRIPIGQYIDHGESVEQDRPQSLAAWKEYVSALAATNGKRRSVVPGETLPLIGIGFRFVTANRDVLGHPLVDSGPNALCEGSSSDQDSSDANGENASSLGYLLSLGKFEFLNLGDLTVSIQNKLACPSNLIGVIDLYQVPHHGNGVSPQLTRALAPTVAVLNNGPNKGGGPEGFEVISSVPGIKAVWQLHRPLKTDDKHCASERMTANLTEKDDAGHWIKATVRSDGGSYVIENGRNGYREIYLTK